MANASTVSSAVDQIHLQLREQIARGDIGAGAWLRETELAQTFGCSTTPVREALRRLDGDGLVTVHPRRGAQVVALQLLEVQHLYEIKIPLECASIRNAAGMYLTEVELQPLRDLIARQDALLPEDPKGSSLLSAEIHAGFAGLAGNQLLADIVERSTRLIECVKSRYAAQVPHGGVQTHAHHSELVDLIAGGDADAAEAALRQHLEWARDAVMEALSLAYEPDETELTE